MDRYVCTICGHVYNPERGKLVQDIRPGIAFADLPGGLALPGLLCSKRPV